MADRMTDVGRKIRRAGPTPADLGHDLAAVTAAPFTPRSKRETPAPFGSITTTEVCDLSCVMCPFNGPDATKKGGTLAPEQVRKIVDQVPRGSQIYFAATGEFFLDPNAVSHVAYAVQRGLEPLILTHGQSLAPDLIDRLLAVGARAFRISCDSHDAKHYERVRRGGKLEKILAAVDYLNQRRSEFPALSIEINCTLFRKTFGEQQSFEEFWSGKVDRINFNAEYHDTFKFRNLFYMPEKRVDCKIQTYVTPTGKIAPCCAIMVYQHENNVDWLPSITTHTLEQAYQQLCDMYDDPASPLAKHCKDCQWWIMWSPHVAGQTPYNKSVALRSEPATGCEIKKFPETDSGSIVSRLIGRMRRATPLRPL